MEWRRREDLRGAFKRVERGWCLGGEQLRQELLEQVEMRLGPSHFGEAVQQAEVVQAERLRRGSRGHLAWLLQQHARGGRTAPTGQALLEM